MKKGFTLAEVLITLGILAFVAAVTLPALQSNIQIQELETKFRKTFVDLNNFAASFQEEFDESIPKYIISINNDDDETTVGSESMRQEFVKHIVNAAHVGASIPISVTSNYAVKSLQDPTVNAPSQPLCDIDYYTDGVGRIFSFGADPVAGKNGPRVCVDINGTKKPNTYGIDVFSFLFTIDGSVIPEGTTHRKNNYGAGIEGAKTLTGKENCYNSDYAQACAYYAQKNENPKNPNEQYWKHFIGEKQYLEKVPEEE